MKKNILPVLVMSCFMIICTHNIVFAKTLPDSTKGTISTTGTASNSYPPDTSEIVLAVETTKETVSDAAHENSAVSERVIDSLKSIIDKAGGDMIKTSSYSIHPKYEYDSKRKKNRFIGYLVTNQITVKTGTLNVIGKIIDSAIEQGANRVHNISFTIDDDNDFCGDLLDKAAKRGKQEAEIVARSLGTAITGIKSASSSCTDFSKPPVYPRGFAMERADAKSVPSIEPGSIKITGNVNLVFFIDNSD